MSGTLQSPERIFDSPEGKRAEGMRAVGVDASVAARLAKRDAQEDSALPTHRAVDDVSGDDNMDD